MSKIITPELMKFVKTNFYLSLDGYHGIAHWARVHRNGMTLVEYHPTASKKVIELFAFLHDSRRIDEGYDPDHGHNSSLLVHEINDRFLFLSKEEADLLSFACKHHSDGHMDADITVQICWDADRLDLGRVGVVPLAERLCTETARNSKVIERAYQRSIQ